MSADGKETRWIEPLVSLLAGAGQALRMSRNDMGHPTGVRAGQEDALQLLTIFPRFAEACVEALAAL